MMPVHREGMVLAAKENYCQEDYILTSNLYFTTIKRKDLRKFWDTCSSQYSPSGLLSANWAQGDAGEFTLRALSSFTMGLAQGLWPN